MVGEFKSRSEVDQGIFGFQTLKLQYSEDQICLACQSGSFSEKYLTQFEMGSDRLRSLPLQLKPEKRRCLPQHGLAEIVDPIAQFQQPGFDDPIQPLRSGWTMPILQRISLQDLFDPVQGYLLRLDICLADCDPECLLPALRKSLQ
jgi:hypothetical protein